MSISSELLTLQNTKTAIRTAINNKGGSVGASDTFASYATAIDNLPSGGSNADLIDLIEGDITTLNIPSGTTQINEYAFYKCEYLTSITIPNTVRVIKQCAFMNCNRLVSISIPSTVDTIQGSCFENCQALSSFSFSDNIIEIGARAFFGTGLLSVNIPSSVTSIKGQAFTACRSLNYVVVNATTPPTLANANAFTNTNDCPIYVPAESVDTYKAASNWSSLASRIYPITQVATVDGNPVYNYDIGNTDSTVISDTERSKIPTGDSIEFAEGVTQIGGQLGAYEEVVLPSTFTSFNDTQPINAATTTLTSKATTPPSVERSNLGGSGLTAVYVPASAVDTYKAHAAWGTFSSIIQAIPTE